MTSQSKTSLRTLKAHQSLAYQLARREVVGRYRGSVFGLAWSFFNPLLMLVVYTTFFTQVFQARWGAQGEGKGVFATALFVGLIVHGMLAESASKGAASLVGNPNFVKKIVFPIAVLPWSTVLAAMFHGVLSVLVLLVGALAIGQGIPWTVLLWPLMLVPIALLCAGLGWLLSAGAVYFRDVGQLVAVLVTVLLFTSPVFFPADTLPAGFRTLVAWNPLTFPIEQSRALLLWGGPMDWLHFLRYTACVALFAGAALWLFRRAQRGFADVL